MNRQNVLDCLFCQPRTEPVIEGSSIQIALCKCISMEDCQCEEYECHCFTCTRRKKESSGEQKHHKRQESTDWREMELQSPLQPLDYKKHSKLCACRGSGMGCDCKRECQCPTMK